VRLTNGGVSRLFLLGFGRQLNDIIFRAAIAEWISKYGNPPPATWSILDFIDPIDHVMVSNGLYVRGDVVNVVGTIYVCLTTGTTDDPVDGTDAWLSLAFNRK